MRTHGSVFNDLGAAWRNLTSTHDALEQKLVAEAQAQLENFDATPQIDHSGRLKARISDGSLKIRYFVLRRDILYWYEEGRPFDPDQHTLNVRLCAVRVVADDIGSRLFAFFSIAIRSCE